MDRIYGLSCSPTEFVKNTFDDFFFKKDPYTAIAGCLSDAQELLGFGNGVACLQQINRTGLLVREMVDMKEVIDDLYQARQDVFDNDFEKARVTLNAAKSKIFIQRYLYNDCN